MLGFMLMHGALHMLNDMKTFGEAGVTIAKDGPGTQRQKQDIKGDTI
jgi:nicotinate-nucleotide--dimethylbenzimidazole phosphoribosyltransferase